MAVRSPLKVPINTQPSCLRNLHLLPSWKSGNGCGQRILISADHSDQPGEQFTEVVHTIPTRKIRQGITSKSIWLIPFHCATPRDALLLHGALAEHAGRGVILIAQGGTGKTTASGRLPSTLAFTL